MAFRIDSGLRRSDVGETDAGDTSASYEIDHIVARRVRKARGKKKIQYLVKWLGWPEEHNEWYGLQDLENAKEAVKDFETSLAAEKALSNSLPRRRRVVAPHAKP
ncbi:hypothetical protein KEM55_006933 [Ascosphaera atra]|nr:hypothetical protein KEM55_006933 [Ascosphaera atra]